MLQRSWYWFVLAGLALLVGLGVFAATVPSGDYLYVPNEARPVADKVEVENERVPDAAGGVYYVDVTLRRARWLDRLAPFLRPEGATLVPGHAVTAPGQTFKQRIAAARSEMSRSKQIAAAVAMKAAGLRVEAVPRGALVEAVALDVPAAGTLASGDVIVGAAGRAVQTPAELRDAVGTVSPGDDLRVRFRRDDKPFERTVQTVAAPDDERRAIIGVSVDQAVRIRLPREVEIDLGDVGGPSAGLPFALEVFQSLGNDVDRGYRVAATGKVELDGTVASVGGIKQKTYGVRSAEADVFLVPAGGNAATARRYAGALRVIAVRSFADAVRALRALPAK